MTGSHAPDAVSRGAAGVPTALWLLPCPHDAQWLQELIRGLAQRHGGPVFEPHITLHVGECPEGVDPGHAISKIAALWPSLNLVAHATGESDAYYRSLYLEIADDRSDGVQLGRLRQQLVLALQGALSSYDFRPHLSLLYGKLSQPLRAALARQNEFKGRVMQFDRIAAVRPAPGRLDLAEVADWEVFGHQRLTAVPERRTERDL